MVAKMKNDKNSLVLLSSKRTKADTRTRADEAFALPSFPESAPVFQMELPPRSCKEVAMGHHHEKDLENLKQTMLQHETMFKAQVRELHRLYQVQRLLMAGSKGKVIRTSSDPASSNSSLVNSSDSLKAGGERSPLEAVSGSKFSFMQKYQDLASVPGQFTPSDHQIHVNAAQEAAQHLEEFSNSKYHQKVACRRTFDLERPAEEYMDVDYVEEKLTEGDNLPRVASASKVSCSSRAPISQSPLSGKDVNWSPSMSFEREIVDSVHTGTFGKNAKVSEENGGEKPFLFQYPGCGEASSFSLVPLRLDYPSQEGLVFPTPVLSTKSLLGGLLGQNHESQLEDKFISSMQHRDSAEHKGRRMDGEPSKPGTDQRATQENSMPPWWIMQGQAASMKTLPSQSLTQNSEWQQSLPFFTQKLEDLDIPRKFALIAEEKRSPSISQELTKAGNTWWSNNGTGFYQGQIVAMGLQGMPSSGLSPTGSTSQVPYTIFPQVGESSNHSIPVLRDDKDARVFPVFTSNTPSAPAVDMPAPILDTHVASMMFPLGFGSRGIVHGPTTQPWSEQNGLFSLMQQQQMAKLSSGSLPLAGEKSLLGDYKVEDAHCSGFANKLGCDFHGLFKATDDASYSIMHSVPLTTRPEIPLKRPVFGYESTTNDVELTLGLSTNKINEDISCFGQLTVKQEEFDRLPFMGDGFERKAQTGKVQLRETNSFFSEDCCTRDGKIKAIHKGFQHGIGTLKSTGLHEASSINVLQIGLSQKVTDTPVREGREILFPDTIKVNEVVHQQRIEEFALPHLPNVTASKKQGHNLYQNTVEDRGEQLSVRDESEVVSSIGECNDGRSRNETVLNQYRKLTVPVAECAFSGGADIPFGRVITGGGTLLLGKSSDVSVVTSCEVREAIPQAICNANDEANSGCGEACQRLKLGHAHGESENGVVASSSHAQTAAEACEEASISVRNKHDFDTSPVMHNSFAVFKFDPKNDVLKRTRQDCSDDRESDNSRKHVDEFSDHSNQAAEILLSLTSDVSSVLEKKATEDYAVHTQERSLEWLANVIPREDESGTMLWNKDTPGSFQPPETFEGIKSAFEQLGETESRNSEVSVDDRLKEVQTPKKLDFFETVTLMRKASDHDTDEISLQAIDRWHMAEECQSLAVHPPGRSSRRGRVGKDFQRETLPSIASLSRQEITEDIQTLGGLMRSATEMAACMSASCLSFKEDSCKPTGLNSINHGRTEGHHMNIVTKSSRKDDMDQNGFPQISSWGELTRRRRMRRHRSRWSLLPLGIGMSSS